MINHFVVPQFQPIYLSSDSNVLLFVKAENSVIPPRCESTASFPFPLSLHLRKRSYEYGLRSVESLRGDSNRVDC